MTDLAGLVGADADAVARRLGEPDAVRTAGGESWMVYRRPGASLRLRFSGAVDPAGTGGAPTSPTASGGDGAAARGDGADAGGAPDGPGHGPARPGDAGGRGAGDRLPRVASWIATLESAPPTLREAAEPLGLWPACAPDVAAADVDGRMARRPLPAGDGGPTHSLTATVDGGAFVRLAAFDEPPEWV